MKTSKIITALATCLIVANSYSQHRNSSGTDRVKIVAEDASLTIATKTATIGQTNQSAIAIAGAIIPPLIDIGTKVITHYSERSAGLYTGSYNCKASMDGFYVNAVRADNGQSIQQITINLPVLKIERQIIIKGQSSPSVAVLLTLTPVLSSDGRAFRYVLLQGTQFYYNYSIAKTVRKFDYMDISIDIKVKSISVNKEKYEVADLRGTTMDLHIIQVKTGTNTVTKDITSGWIPLPPPNTKTNPPATHITTVLTTSSKTVSPTTATDKAAPTSSVSTDSELKTEQKDVAEDESQYTNTGLLEFDITVTETNIYKVKAEERQKLIESTSEPVVDLLKKIVEKATKSGDDDDKEKEE